MQNIISSCRISKTRVGLKFKGIFLMVFLLPRWWKSALWWQCGSHCNCIASGSDENHNLLSHANRVAIHPYSLVQKMWCNFSPRIFLKGWICCAPPMQIKFHCRHEDVRVALQNAFSAARQNIDWKFVSKIPRKSMVQLCWCALSEDCDMNRVTIMYIFPPRLWRCNFHGNCDAVTMDFVVWMGLQSSKIALQLPNKGRQPCDLDSNNQAKRNIEKIAGQLPLGSKQNTHLKESQKKPF